jgi:hypothetical protein
MKIGILTEIIMDIKIDIDGEFEPLGTNRGHVVTSFDCPAMELALKLSSDNEVLLFSSIGPPSYVQRALAKRNINTKYMPYKLGGFGAHIDFGRPDGRETVVWSSASIKHAVKQMQMDEAEIFEDMDAMVVTDIFGSKKVVGLCKKHEIPVFWLANKGESSDLDDGDKRRINGIKVITVDNYLSLLRNNK